MKNIYQLVKPLTLILVLCCSFATNAQTLSDGPMNLQLRADAFWRGRYEDLIDNTEESELIWFRDNADVDGQGWVGGNCFTWVGPSGGGGFPLWSPAFNTVVYNQTFSGATTPRYFNIQFEGWEDDRGSSCSYDGPCSICDSDDDHCGAGQVGGNYEFRTIGPPCTWTQTEIVPFGGGNCDYYGARVSSYYTPALPNVSGTSGCAPVTLTASMPSNAPSWGASFNWYTSPSGGSAVNSGPTFVLNTPGTYTYYVETVNACSSLARRAITVTVSGADNPAFTYSQSTYCKTLGTNPSANITGTTGTFSSSPSGLVFTNTTTGTINLTASTAGTYTITYTTNGPCPQTQQRTVTIVNGDNPAFSYSQASYCTSVGSVSPTISGLNGGNFTVTPNVGLSINNANGVINTTASTPGTYDITYTTTGSCPATQSHQVTIVASDDASFSYAQATYCQDSPNQTPVVTGTPGGSFSSTPSGLVINPADGTINLQSSLTGIPFTITRLTSGTCPASTTFGVTIIDNPNAPTASSPTPICEGAPVPQLTASGLGGTINWYDAPTGGALLQANSSVYNPQVNTAGTYDYYVEEVGQASCASTRTQVTLLINPLPLAPAVTPNTSVCIGDAAPILSASGINSVFNWYSAQVGGTLLQANNSNFTPPVNVVGSITYYVQAVGPGNCSSLNRTPVTVTVNPLPLVGIATTDNTLCGNDPIVPIFGFPSGGSLSPVQGVVGSTFNPAIAPIGGSTVVYSFTDANTCTNTASQAFTVYPVPAPTIATSGTTVLCNGGDVTLDAGAGYASYAWSDDNSSTSQTITVGTSGTYSVTVTSTDGCIGAATAPIVVSLVPDTFVAGPQLGDVTVFCTGTTINTTLDAGAGFTDYLWTPGNSTGQTLNVTAPGDYAVTVTSPLGCLFTDTVSVGFTTLSAVITADGPLNFCLGDTVALTVLPAYSYLWTSGSTTQGIEVNHTGTYGVVVRDQYGCEATDSVDVVVDFPPIANFNYGQQNSSIAMNFFDFSMNADSYAWTFGDNGTSTDANPEHTYGSPGEYVVTLTVTNSCGTDTYTDTVLVKVVSVPELAIDKFAVYPNPTDGNLEVRFTSTINQGIEIRVVNAMGQLVNGEVINNFSGQFNRTYNLSGLAAGMYMFQIVTERGVRTERVILAK